ncbi:hypothetical protein GEOBRER4_n0852 [Citrifermentans bremense]|uniref:Uncharacterized protein n=1 Tax=Citrifermentans bremense TaxID=60035 RepID=A0A7R7IY49_9BACT|nr:hypothetical protein GEOBRER4_n0852 [Citrifermentans bremense]
MKLLFPFFLPGEAIFATVPLCNRLRRRCCQRTFHRDRYENETTS